MASVHSSPRQDRISGGLQSDEDFVSAYDRILKTNRSLAVNSEANARRITLVENCFGSAGQQLCVPGRVLVGEGVLTKMCRKKPKPRQFFLFNDILVYGNIIINKKKYNKQHVIPLEEVNFETKLICVVFGNARYIE